MLNNIQAKKLADFFLDMAKGLILGGLGFATIVPVYHKLLYALLSFIFAYWCVKLALNLLENIE